MRRVSFPSVLGKLDGRSLCQKLQPMFSAISYVDGWTPYLPDNFWYLFSGNKMLVIKHCSVV